MDYNNYINVENFRVQARNYGKEGPFNHIIIDNFFIEDLAMKLFNEFPNYEDKRWHNYDNPIEVKKICNNWNLVPKNTYQTFQFLNSPDFINLISNEILNQKKIYADYGLNGGGWHIHKKGGKLNPHLDYSLHPKSGKQRKLNIIIYVNPNWSEDWGGQLGFWDNSSAEKPGELKKIIWSKFNRAVIFDTTQNSWHGLPNPIKCPKEESRKSLAVYYLCEPPEIVDKREKALFAPTKEQEGDDEVLELIKKRANAKTAAEVYEKK